MTLKEYCQIMIDGGSFDLSMPQAEFVSRCRGFGICGWRDGESMGDMNFGDAEFTLCGKHIDDNSYEREVLFKGSWGKLYDYLQREFNNKDYTENVQITFW